MSLSLLSGPAVEPVDLTTAKAWLRVDNTSDDAEILSMISDARRWVEDRTSTRLITQTWRWTLDIHWKHQGISDDNEYNDGGRVPERYGDRVIRYGMWIQHQPYLRFPLWPVQSISQITYRQGGADVTYTGTPRVLPNGKIIFNPSDPPPLPDEQEGAVTVDCVCGYGDTAAAVPGNLIRGIKMLCGHWYENRGLYFTSGAGERIVPGEMDAAVSDLIQQHRKLSI